MIDKTRVKRGSKCERECASNMEAGAMKTVPSQTKERNFYEWMIRYVRTNSEKSNVKARIRVPTGRIKKFVRFEIE